ncbi:MAG: DUF1859 domain-containing protein [Alphaproteobacteria bacterium]|nr:DUF1859 domain-containing protein [Alphaproteobacteria bacterium]
MTTPLNTQQFAAYKPALGQKNMGDPRSMAAVCDFSAGGTLSYFIDMSQVQAAGTIGGIKTIYVDNSANNQVLTISPSVAGQMLKCPASCQGFFPVLAPTPAQFTVSMTGGTAKSTVILLDFEVPYQVWNTAGLNNLIFNGSGYALVSDAAIDAIISGGALATKDQGLDAIISGGKLPVSDATLESIVSGGVASVTVVGSTANGLSTYSAVGGTGNALLTNAAVAVKGAAGKLAGASLYNAAAAVTFLQFFDLAPGAVVLGTTVPKFVIAVSAAGVRDIVFTDINVQFNTQITVAATTTATGNTAPATGLQGAFFFN